MQVPFMLAGRNINNNDKLSNFQSEIGNGQISIFSPIKNTNFLNDIDVSKNIFQKNLIMEVKEAYISNKHIGYYFFFKKIQILKEQIFNQLGKPIMANQSPNKKPNLKRPSVRFVNENEESAKSSRIYNDEEEENSIMNKNSNGKASILSNKRNSVNFDLEVMSPLRKYDSAKMLLNIYDESYIVNDKYIPKSCFNFFLDLESLSFKPSTKLDSCKELYQSLKFQSIQKLNIIYKATKKEIINSSSKTDNSSQKSFDSLDDNNSSSSISLSKTNSSEGKNSDAIKNQKSFKRKNNKRKEYYIEKSNFNRKNVNVNIDNYNNDLKIKNNDIKKQIDFDNEYYKVNINKIKFMIYDFTQEMAISNNKIEKKSQIEILLENYKSRNNINISEDINYPNISIEKFNIEPKNKKYKNNEINMKKKSDQKEINLNTKLHDKEKEFEKEINYALSKQDEQKSIIIFSQISFIFFILILLMGFFEIFFFIKNYSSLKENLNLVIYSIGLKYISNLSVYFLREKSLLSINYNITDGNYKVPHSSIELYKFLINNETKKIFEQGNTNLEDIIGTNLKLSENSSYFLTQKYYNIEILYNNNSCIKNASNNFYTSLIHVYSAFCNLLARSDEISVDDSNLYNYIHNSFNSLGDMLNLQIELFEKDLSLIEKNIKTNIIIYTCIYFILHIIIHLLIRNSYFSIIKKKASYISVFYGIGLPLIKSSIKKCEFFINRMNKNEENEKIKNIDENESSFISSFKDKNINKKFIDNSFERKSINIKNIEKTKKSQKCKKLGKDKQSKQFKILYKILLIFSFLYLVLIFNIFINFTKYFIICGEYLFNMQNYQNNVLNLFNIYREYLFDENAIISRLPSYEYLIKKEELFYLSNTANINILIVLSSYFKGLYKKYANFQGVEFCNVYIAYFNSKEECVDFMGGENGILSLGFHLLINHFIEEIRNSRNYMNLLLEKKILIGNLSENIKLENNKTFLNLLENNNLTFRMKVFNLNQTHYRLNIIFQNIILQNINQERIMITDSIKDSVINGHLIYIIFIIAYIALFVLVFLFYWIPMIKKVNNEIYKTKKLLSIIPVQILASQPNIKELLNISTNND